MPDKSSELPEAREAHIRPLPLPVTLERTAVPTTKEVAFWEVIRRATDRVSFGHYERFINEHCGATGDEQRQIRERLKLPFFRVEAYELLKAATECFLKTRALVQSDLTPDDWSRMAEKAELHLGRHVSGEELEQHWIHYVGPNGTIPFLDMLAAKFGEYRHLEQGSHDALSTFILQERLNKPILIELIWSYWLEEAMLVQVLNAVSLRFQNRRAPGDRPMLAHLDLDPLRPLGNLMWGYVQDEQHRLTIARRAYEYDHQYGLRLLGKAVGTLQPADTRSNFLEAFHRLLHLTARFYTQDDDTTVRADAFPLLNALKEVNIALGDGASNQYGDLAWVARGEMLMQQYILARPEMREFLSSRPSTIYPERWMERIESAKSLMGISGPSVLHMYNLATMGERLLLSIRLHPWTAVSDTPVAANWARSLRSDVQGYIHGYHAVTGVDLSASAVAERIDARLPSVLIRQRREAMGR